MINRTKERRPKSGACVTGLNDPDMIGSSLRRHGGAGPLGGVWMEFLLSVVLLFALATGLRAVPVPAPYTVASAEFESGKFQEASETLENALRQNPENASFELLLARCYYELKDWDRAAAHAESAEELEPQNAEAHLWLGQIYGRKAAEERSLVLAVRTRKEFEKAVSLDPSNVDARRDLMEFYLEAPWVLGGGKGKAKKQADAIATLNAAEGALARAQFDEKTGETSEAETEFRRVLELNPHNVGPYLDVADFFQTRQDFAGMEAAVAAASKVNPSDPRLSYYRGVIDILQANKLDDAEREFKAYLATAPERSTYPSRASALGWLGELYERAGKPQLAAREYQAALQLDPDLAPARQGLDRVGNRE